MRGPRRDAKPCRFCGASSTKLCDEPLRDKRAGATCSAPMCDRCATVIMVDSSKSIDLCPPHERARRPGLELAAESLRRRNEARAWLRTEKDREAREVDDLDKVDRDALIAMFPDWQRVSEKGADAFAVDARSATIERTEELCGSFQQSNDGHRVGAVVTGEMPSTIATASIADKVAHVKRAGQTRDHACHWPTCTRQVPPAMWGCREHWYMLPPGIRDAIWRAYAPGQEQTGRPSTAYVDAARAAQQWIEEVGLDVERRRATGGSASWERAVRRVENKRRPRS
jgi:hypothetical protein